MTSSRDPANSSDGVNHNDDDNMLSISEIDNALEECGQEIQTLYRSLDLVMDRQVRLAQEKDRMQLRLRQQQDRQEEQAAARQQRQHEEEAIRQCEQEILLEQQRQQQEKEQQQQQQESEDTLAKHARIAELRRQIQEVEDATKTATVAATTTTPTPIPAAKQEVSEPDDLTAPTTPTQKKNSKWKNPFKKSKSPTSTDSSPSPLPSPTRSTTSTSDNASSNVVETTGEVCKGQDYKQKHEWERPAWALPSDAVQEDADILTAPIQNGMLKEANKNKGYTRRCHAKDIHNVKGNFIAASKDPAPASRFAWLVLNIDGDKVGKIVMHLKEDTSNNENVDRLVSQFLDLKGLAMERTKDGNLVVKDVSPQLVVTMKKAPVKKKGKTNNVIGEVEEGQDVFETVLKAGADSIVTIKQAHIYPVKKAKGMFA
jgi:chemotaxis protein histidine kinase CheA